RRSAVGGPLGVGPDLPRARWRCPGGPGGPAPGGVRRRCPADDATAADAGPGRAARLGRTAARRKPATLPVHRTAGAGGRVRRPLLLRPRLPGPWVPAVRAGRCAVGRADGRVAGL